MNHNHDSRNSAPVPYLVEELADNREPHLEQRSTAPQPRHYEAWRQRIREKEPNNATRYSAPQPEQPPLQRYPLQQLTAWQVLAAYIGAHLLRPLATAAAIAIIGTATLTVYLNFAKITKYLTW